MACIIRRPESKYFIACWTDKSSRWLKRSTKTTDRKLALKLANQYEEEARTKRTAGQARRVLTEIYRGLSGNLLPTTTVRAFFVGFVEWKRPEVSQATLEYYSGHSKRFLAWLGPKANQDITEISKATITAYRNHIASGAGPRTTNNTLKAVKAFFAEDPAADVDTVRDRTGHVAKDVLIMNATLRKSPRGGGVPPTADATV